MALVSWPAGLGVPKRRLERLEGGFGVFACGVRGAKKAFGGFGGWLVSLPAGLGVPNRHLERLECLERLKCLRPGKWHA